MTMAFLLLLRLLPPLRLIEDIDDGWDDEKACTASIENGNDDCAPLRRQRLPPVDDDDEDDDAKSTIIAAIAEDERLFFISGRYSLDLGDANKTARAGQIRIFVFFRTQYDFCAPPKK